MHGICRRCISFPCNKCRPLPVVRWQSSRWSGNTHRRSVIRCSTQQGPWGRWYSRACSCWPRSGALRGCRSRQPDNSRRNRCRNYSCRIAILADTCRHSAHRTRPWSISCRPDRAVRNSRRRQDPDRRSDHHNFHCRAAYRCRTHTPRQRRSSRSSRYDSRPTDRRIRIRTRDRYRLWDRPPSRIPRPIGYSSATRCC
jgi:hypothetical protein